MIVLVFRLGKSEDCFMYIWIKFLSKRLRLHHSESLQTGVHDLGSHIHALRDLSEMLLQLLNIFNFVYLYLLDVVTSHLQVVSDIQEVLSELRDGELPGLIDLLLVSLDCVVILRELVDELLLVLLHLLL